MLSVKYFSANRLKPILKLKPGPSCDGEILRSKQNKEMKIQNLLKFFLLLEEDRGSVHHMRSASALSLLSSRPFSQHKNSLLWRAEDRKGKVEAAFLKWFQVFFNHLLHDLPLFSKYKQKCLDVSLACCR